MNEETAKELAAAMRALADAINNLRGNGLQPGIPVYHYGQPFYQTPNPMNPPYHWTAGGTGNDPIAWRTT